MEQLNLILLLVVLAVMLISFVYMAVTYFRQRTLDEIRKDVYQLILQAKHQYQDNQGKQKMKWVVGKARLLLPKWLEVFITDEILEKIIQTWFNGVKDLLDDGKMNGSDKSE